MSNETDLRLAQPPLMEPPFCGACPDQVGCHARHTQLACSELGNSDPSVLHYLSPDWLQRYAEVNTFDFNVAALAQPVPPLPAYIPAVRPHEWRNGLQGLTAEAVAIPLDRVQALVRQAQRSGRSARQVLRLRDHQLLVVLGFAHDRFLEQQWSVSKRSTLILSIQELCPDLAVAWNYSVWHRQANGLITSRPDQRYNVKRSLKVYAEMQAIGITTIPHMYWGIPDDLESWAQWLAENPSVTVASVDLQTLDNPRSWNRALQALADFRSSLLPRRVHMLFSGRCLIDRVTELKTIWPESSLTNSGAQFGSGSERFKKCYGLNRPWLVNPDAWNRTDRFNEICRQYAALFDSRSVITPNPSSVA